MGLNELYYLLNYYARELSKASAYQATATKYTI